MNDETEEIARLWLNAFMLAGFWRLDHSHACWIRKWKLQGVQVVSTIGRTDEDIRLGFFWKGGKGIYHIAAAVAVDMCFFCGLLWLTCSYH